MRSFMQAGNAAAAALVLAACATYEFPTPYWTIKESAFQGLTPGKTSQADVRKQVGIPESTMRFAAKGEEIWEYRYLLTTYGMIAHVHFDLQGVYKYVYHMPDPVINGSGLDG